MPRLSEEEPGHEASTKPTMIVLYSLPKKGKGTLRVKGFDELSSPGGPGTSLVLTPKGILNIPDNFKRGGSVYMIIKQKIIEIIVGVYTKLL